MDFFALIRPDSRAPAVPYLHRVSNGHEQGPMVEVVGNEIEATGPMVEGAEVHGVPPACTYRVNCSHQWFETG